MTDSKPYVSTRELLEKIEALEKKLVPPEKPDMNAMLRAEIDRVSGKSKVTRHIDTIFPAKKEK